MQILKKIRWISLAAFFVAPLVITGCASRNTQIEPASLKPDARVVPPNERRCLERVMFFESNRSSRAGMIAVGTVVMNRVNSSAYPNTICGVVGQKRQFAPGVLTRPMESRAMPIVKEAADAVLKGERDPKLKNAMFFHTAGLKFPYQNMRYVRVAGGNAFYEKRRRDGGLQVPVNDQPYNVALAYAQETQQSSPIFDMLRRPADRSAGSTSVAVASAEYRPIRFDEAKTPVSQAQTISVDLPTSNIPVPTFVDTIVTKSVSQSSAQPSEQKMAEVAALLVAQQREVAK